ncbi:MAG: MATE family efflux transporter [Pseudomonadota bacterium]
MDRREERGAARTAEPEAAHPPGVFVEGDLRGHVISMSLAGSVGLMAIFLVDLADLFFISLLGQTELAAAIGYAATVIFFTMAVSIGLAIAVSAMLSRALGEGQVERARLWASHGLAVAMLTALVVGLLVWANALALIEVIGAEGETARLGAGFLAIVAPSLPLTAAMMCSSAILRSHGAARRAMWVTLSSAAVNGVLDPIFIFGLGLGLDGAAWATVASRAASAAVGVWLILRFHGGFAPIRWSALAPDLRPLAAIAGPAMATNVATPVGVAFVTRMMAEFGDAAVAGNAIVMRLTPVAFGFVFALSGAIGPIIGQNYGAQKYDRVRETLREAVMVLAVYVVAASALLYVLSGVIIAGFGAEGEAARLITWFCGPLSLLFFFNGVLFATNAAFNNLGRPLTSTMLNWGRHTLGVVPFALGGAALFGAPGALLGQLAGGIAFALLALWLAHRLVDQHAAGAAQKSDLPPLWRLPNWPAASPKD